MEGLQSREGFFVQVCYSFHICCFQFLQPLQESLCQSSGRPFYSQLSEFGMPGEAWSPGVVGFVVYVEVFQVSL